MTNFCSLLEERCMLFIVWASFGKQATILIVEFSL